MKKLLLMILILALLAININCGGGAGSSANTSGRTTVAISLGETRTASHASGGLLSAASTIPSDVTSIKFTISATDMVTIERVISVTGRTTISESFEVPTGANRHFLVKAMDASGNVLFRGETFANLDGTPTSLTIVMVSTDVTPPDFSGLSTITSITTTSLVLSWAPATDIITPQNKIQYLIYMSTTPGGENFASPSFTTSPGVTSFSVTGLSPDTTYYFMVRAMDERGNIDTNLFEKSATTLAPPDIIKPTFGGIVSATAVSSTEINLSWGSATDDRTASSNIVYLIYMSTTSGGENLASPTASITGGTSKTITGLTPGTTYYFVVRARDEAGNIDTNTVEKFTTTLALPDTTPPTFGGLGSATAVSSTEISLSWNPATDNATPSSNIVYLIYMSTISGGENFAMPSFITSPGVISFSVTGLSPGTTYYFVVRARDASGNIDTNSVEWSATTLAPPEVSPPEDIALNLTGSGFPHPLESDRGWGGGSYPWEIIDSKRLCPKEGASGWACGLAFTGGSGSWDGETCGWRQATINLGEPKAFNRVVVWHHGLEHVPNTYKIQYWDGTNWVDIFSTTNGHSYLKFPTDSPRYWWESWSTPTENTFPDVTSSKVRFALDNCDITHGWIYEFEVYKD